MKNTIEIMNQIITTSQIEAKRGKTALAVDRLRQAASEATLLKCINRFFELMQSDMQYIRHDAYLEFMRSASVFSVQSGLNPQCSSWRRH